MKQLRALLPHLTIILSITVFVLWILDYFNPMMQFLTSGLPKALLLALLLCACATAIGAIAHNRKS